MGIHPKAKIPPEGDEIPTLRNLIPNARVMVYNHGRPDDGDDLDSLATRLLDHVMSERSGDVRPTTWISVTLC